VKPGESEKTNGLNVKALDERTSGEGSNGGRKRTQEAPDGFLGQLNRHARGGIDIKKKKRAEKGERTPGEEVGITKE